MSEVAEAVPAAPAAEPAPPTEAPAEAGTPPAPTAAGTAPATPKGDETTPETQDPAKKQGTSRFERRISRLHREAAEARAERDLLKRQYEELKTKAAPSVDPSAPRMEDFSDIEAYATAKAKHEASRTLREHQQRQQSETIKQEQNRLAQEWESKVARADVKYDDFDELVGELIPNNPVVAAIMEAENGEDIAYHLATNPKVAQRIVALPLRAQIREIGKLEAKLASEPPKPKTPSKAPAPITPLTGAAPVVSDAPSDNDDYPDWFKKRNKQVHASRLVHGKPRT